MKKNLIILTVALLLLSCGRSRQAPDDSVAKWNSGDIKGSVKSIIAVTDYPTTDSHEGSDSTQEADVSLEVYNIKGMLSESRWYSNDSLLVQQMLYTYDENGKLTRNDYIERSENQSQPDSSYFLFTYNNDGLLVKKETYHNHALSFFAEKEYDENGDIVLHKIYYEGTKVSEDTYRYTYNSDGRKTEETLYRNGVLSLTMRWQYDAAGRTTSVETTEEGNVLTETYRYDSKNRLVEEVLAPGGTGIKRITTYTYDGKDNMVELTLKTEEGNILHSRTYTYDTQGNWIQSVDKTGASQVICRRKIDYCLIKY